MKSLKGLHNLLALVLVSITILVALGCNSDVDNTDGDNFIDGDSSADGDDSVDGDDSDGDSIDGDDDTVDVDTTDSDTVDVENESEDTNKTALDEYVAAPDESFSCSEEPDELVETIFGSTSTFKLYSQTWRDSTEVDRPLWEHWLSITTPKDPNPKRAMLFITGGSNREEDAPDPDETLEMLASMTKSVIAMIAQVPNERLKFSDEWDERYMEDGRTEDEIIGYAWDKFLNTSDPTWLPRLPMTKAAVRAMDIVQRECPSVEEFTIVGASKRGWTTWTVGAVDDRVIAIVPAVIDVLNVVESLDNHFAAYGFWAPATHDYVDTGVLARLHTPEFKEMCDIIDPYSYLDRYTMPKYIINSTGDQFFAPDSWQFYYDDLPGEKYLRYIPNTDHELNTDAYFGLAAFHHAIINDTPLPKFDWHMEEDGTLVVECETKPSKVLLWQATNPDARDFRLEEIGAVYASSVLESSGDGVYRSTVQAPEKGWTAFMIDLEFNNPGAPSMPFMFSTGVSIVPNTLPYANTPQPE